MLNIMSHSIVVFVGPIGAGKSTHIHLLAKYMRNKKKRVIITCLKSYHLFVNIILYLFEKFLMPRRKSKFHPIRLLFESRSHVFRRLFRLLAYLDVLSIALKYLLRVYLPSKLGYCILVEDYVLSTLADYMFLLAQIRLDPHILKGLWLKILIRFLNATPVTMYVYLDADNRALVERWHMRGTPYDRISYVEAQRRLIPRLYKILDDTRPFICINTSDKEPKEVQEHIIAILDKMLKMC